MTDSSPSRARAASPAPSRGFDLGALLLEGRAFFALIAIIVVFQPELRRALVRLGEAPLLRAPMQRGDVMIRDVRHIHRGTPNLTDTPRPMVVIGYSRRWLFRPEVDIRVPRDVLAGLSPRAQKQLRFNPVFDTVEEAAQAQESYRVFAY